MHDMVINTEIMKAARDGLYNVAKEFSDGFEQIKAASASLLEGEAWAGKGRNEFRNTYRIVENALLIDTKQLSSLGDIISGFIDVSEEIDLSAYKSFYDTAKDVGVKDGK